MNLSQIVTGSHIRSKACAIFTLSISQRLFYIAGSKMNPCGMTAKKHKIANGADYKRS